MLLKITAKGHLAEELSFLLHKHPDKLQSVTIPGGKAHIFYPELENNHCTVALLLELDAIEMVKKAAHFTSDEFRLGQYVNDRSYVASSFLTVALSKAFATAMNGTCVNKPELVEHLFDFEIEISVLPASKGGELLIKKLFEPLGYLVKTTRHILDDQFESWGESKYYTVHLKTKARLKDILQHLYVLIPVVEGKKHYWVDKYEVDKLIQKGAKWLPLHPEKDQIISRYLKNMTVLIRQYYDQVKDEEKIGKYQKIIPLHGEKSLHEERLHTVLNILKSSNAKSVIDLGCGEGKLLKQLFKVPQFEKILGVDISYQALKRAHEKLKIEELPTFQKDRISLMQSALTYKDSRIENYDAAALVEVIEHIEEDRLPDFEKALFFFAKPKLIVLTTPNIEYNALFEGMEKGAFRHKDHRFEWTRAQFQIWTERVATEYNYKVKVLPLGKEDLRFGTPSQMAIFSFSSLFTKNKIGIDI